MPNIPLAIYQVAQIRELERLAQKRFGIAADVMMQRAGKAALECLVRRWPHAKSIAVFCGKGNNGGDGYVLARLAAERGLQVTVWQVGGGGALHGGAQQAFAACQQANVLLCTFNKSEQFALVDVIVDAMCGIGLSGKVRGDVLQAIEMIEQAGIPILAIDIPSGIDADNGQVLGKAIKATQTITFIGLKLGLLTGRGVAYAGEVVCHSLQLPAELFSQVLPIAEKTTIAYFGSCLAPRPRDWHKGQSGHVLIIGGDYGFQGAPLLAAKAALRVGAGLVSVATRVEHARCLNVMTPEIMVHGVSAAKELTTLMDDADVIVLGPGLGRSAWSRECWEVAIHAKTPLVVDADGLNLLAEFPQTRADWVLTPHPGEAGRLLRKTSQDIQDDRLNALFAMQKRYGGFCILKGAGSLILSPGKIPVLCDKGNPGMATAGMGDMLSGVLGGLVAQGLPLVNAAPLGVYLHAIAGDLAAAGEERGLIATDLLPYLRQLSNNPDHV
ncbi:MAG: hypothetical protein A3J38_06510 [Gammaproteobacteria bacterium RIFCSPHIGHO2_12_FULL_45_9]|nr:MAG: hypothetical protein A3J38_06510 [Gammaproteobacteria bacterium RIFCSPHIGHO2_12_FULL_45_9]